MREREFYLFTVSDPICAPYLGTLLQFGAHFLPLALRLHIFSVLFFSLPSFSSYADTRPGARCTVHAPCYTTTCSGSLMPAWGIICRIPRHPSSRVSFLSCACVERHQSPPSDFLKFYLFIFLWLFGLHCCSWAFSSCYERGRSLVVMCRLGFSLE